ncbi:MAG: helix-turn-helix transcriptional regulator [Solobacterium sp.]|nr:helix-turn-helix transcriptional regulator [Solobacterium sp.]
MNDVIYVGKHAITYSVSKHLHKNWEIIYCTGGGGELIYGGKSYLYEEDTVAVIPPNCPHVNKSDRGFTNIHTQLADVALSITEPVIITGLKNQNLRNAFEGLFYYYSEGNQESAVILPIYSQLIVTMVEVMISHDEGYTDVVRQIADEILKNYPDPNFDLNSCLHSYSFSKEYLKRIFKQEMGMTPRQFLTEKRLENAAKNLTIGSEKQNISEIARKCGYTDPLYFSKLFKNKYGVSPKNYKQGISLPNVADSDSTKIYLENS